MLPALSDRKISIQNSINNANITFPIYEAVQRYGQLQGWLTLQHEDIIKVSQSLEQHSHCHALYVSFATGMAPIRVPQQLPQFQVSHLNRIV